MIVAIGSKALSQVTACKVKDLDLVATNDHKPWFDSAFRILKESPKKAVYLGNRQVEVEWVLPGSSNEELLQHTVGKFSHPRLGEIHYATPEALTSFYRAHLQFPIQWSKHAPRYWALKDSGYRQVDSLYVKRLSETADRMKYRASRYDKPNASFFRDSVKREVPHDELHMKLAFYERPLFERIKRDMSRSGVCLDLFEALPRETQFESVWEEALVLGHERYRANGVSDEESARLALFGLCTNWYPLEFRPFVLDNFRELLTRFPYQVWNKLQS